MMAAQTGSNNVSAHQTAIKQNSNAYIDIIENIGIAVGSLVLAVLCAETVLFGLGGRHMYFWYNDFQ